MKRREFLLTTFLGPLLLLPKPSKKVTLPPFDFKPLVVGYPKMDRFVNDLPQSTMPWFFYKHPGSVKRWRITS